jgi:hypothetical protein
LFKRRKCNEGMENKEDGVVPLSKLWDKSRMIKPESLLICDGMRPISWLLENKEDGVVPCGQEFETHCWRYFLDGYTSSSLKHRTWLPRDWFINLSLGKITAAMINISLPYGETIYIRNCNIYTWKQHICLR